MKTQRVEGRPWPDPDPTHLGPTSRVTQRPGQWSVSLQKYRPGQVSGQRKHALTRPDPTLKDTTLEESNPEKQYFRALAGLAKATTLLFWAPNGLARDIRKRFIKLLHLYR